MRKANILILGLMASGLVVNAQSRNSDVVVELGGQKFTMAEIEKKEAGRLLQARDQYYQAQKTAINRFIEDQLLEQKAKAEHLTVDELVKRDIASHIAEPTEDQLKFLYDVASTDEPYDKIRPKLVDQLYQQRLSKARAEYIKNLRTQTEIAINLLPPGAETQVEGAPIIGSKSAPVMLVEYADYECPYCRQVHPTLKKLEQDFDGKLSVVFKDCPLPMHSHAKKAAEAAICARNQGKFWEYHDVLFEGAGNLEVPELKENARTLGLNATEFDQCLDSGAEAAKVQHGYEEAQQLGLSGTPSFFINGHFYSGAMKYEQLRAAVEQELAAASQSHELKASK